MKPVWYANRCLLYKFYLKNKKMAINTHISIITLNIKDLNPPIKRHGVVKWVRKQDPYIYSLQDTHLRMKNTHKIKTKAWKQLFHAN